VQSARGEALAGLEGGAPEWRSLASTLPLNRPHRCHSTGRLATLRNISRLAYSTVYPTQPHPRRRTEAGPRVSTLRLVKKWWAPRRPLNSTTRPQTRAWQAQARRTSSEWQHASTVVRTLPLPVSLAAPAAARGLRHPTRQPLPLLRTTPRPAAQATRTEPSGPERSPSTASLQRPQFAGAVCKHPWPPGRADECANSPLSTLTGVLTDMTFKKLEHAQRHERTRTYLGTKVRTPYTAQG
jgi:hypothetical protein